MFLPVEKHWMLPKLFPGIHFFAAILFSNSQNAPFVPDDSCWISKHLRPSSVTWSDLQHGDTVQMYDRLSDASVLLHTQLLLRPTVRCPGLSRKGQPLFPGRWTNKLERCVTVLVLAVIPTNPASSDVVGVCASCCTAWQADFRSSLRLSESSLREIASADKQGCEAGKTWMKGLYSGQCIYFQVPQRCQSCGSHQAKHGEHNTAPGHRRGGHRRTKGGAAPRTTTRTAQTPHTPHTPNEPRQPTQQWAGSRERDSA